MLHLPLPPPSPTSSSVSSSDLDTESTGSFFHDRSITLGTLMGVTFPAAAAFGGPSTSSDQLRSAHQFNLPAGVDPNCSSRKQRRARKVLKRKIVPPPTAAERRRRWWSLCRDAEAKPASLGEFLEVERRYGDAAFFNADEEAAAAAAGAEVEGGFVGRALFADGRVLPPAEAVVVAGGAGGASSSSSAVRGALSRLPVSLTGICSGGVG